AFESLLRQRGSVDAAYRGQRFAQPLGLRIRRVLEALPSACVRLAGDEERVEALRAPLRIDRVKQLEHGCRPKLRRAVNDAMMPSDVRRELAIRTRHRQPLAQRLEALDG